ncbi:MAG TPA: hypothetical protein VGS06_27760 [Streptosporangiaceae bacterium]|nr:hypothetical protein [Streptosporangiaceae bacterium]
MPDVDAISGAKGQRQWLILGVIGLAQLMVILDATVMNIALLNPRHLRLSTGGRR